MDEKKMVQDARKLLKGITKKISPFEKSEASHEIKKSVTKSNGLTRSRYRMTLVEKRVMEMLISKVDPTKPNPANPLNRAVHMTFDQYGDETNPHPYWFSITAKEYASFTKTHEKTAYKEIVKAGKRLEKITIYVTESAKQIAKPLLYKSVYDEGSGCLKVLFHPELIPHILELKEKFTKYPLESAIKFKSTYSWRLYEVLLSIKNTHNKSITYSIDDLVEVLGMPESYTKYWISISRTIEKSMQEITIITDLDVSYTKNKQNKKITSVTLHIEVKK